MVTTAWRLFASTLRKTAPTRKTNGVCRRKVSLAGEAQMLTLLFDHKNRVLLARFSGIYTSDDIAAFDRGVGRFVAEEGAVRGLYDFSRVEAVAVPKTKFFELGRRPQLALDQDRVIVAPQLEIYELARLYAALQRDFGNVEPRIVRTLAEAYELLGLRNPEFAPVAGE